MKHGRRLTFMCATIIAFCGTLIQMAETLSFILLGRFIYGVGCGLLSISAPRFLEETVPDTKLSLYQPIFMTSTAVGILFSLLLGAGLPDESDSQALKESGFWKVIIGCPIPLQVASFLSMLLYVRYDSIRFLINRQNFNEARDMIRQVYDTLSERPNRIIEYIETSS